MMAPATNPQRLRNATTGSTEKIFVPVHPPKTKKAPGLLSRLMERYRKGASPHAGRSTEEKIIDSLAEKHPGIFLT